MSAQTRPISPTRFASALSTLPISALYSKAHELRNSIAHLRSSNAQLQPFAAEGDGECADAIAENEQTMRNMQDRILLIEVEVERNRGLKWMPEGGGRNGQGGNDAAVARGGEDHGLLSDEQLRRRLEQRMGEGDVEANGDGGDGVFL